jgi:hypothetical protein
MGDDNGYDNVHYDDPSGADKINGIGQGGYGLNSEPYIGPGGQQDGGGTPPLKSKVAAGVMAIFLGALGVHNFYLGRNSRALTQLLISLLSFGALAPAVNLWSMVEGVLILTSAPGSEWHLDGYGRELRD